mgnify:CR=1 FL=1
MINVKYSIKNEFISKFRKINSINLFLLFIFSSCSSENKSPLPDKENPEAIKPNPEIVEPNEKGEVSFYKGTTMGFAKHQEEFGNVVFKEEGKPKDPYLSLYDHGANIARFRIDLPPYKNNYTIGEVDLDYRSPKKVKSEIQRSEKAGLKTLLTFSYKSMALEEKNLKNEYVAPLEWQPIANDLGKLKAAVYKHTYDILKDYVNSGIEPAIVSIGNETNWRFIEQNMTEDELPAYDSSRVVALLNSGTKAVRDINKEYSLDMKIVIHLFDASKIKWWLGEHLGLDYDVLGLSHYHELHKMGDFTSWRAVVKWVKSTYKKDFMILETAQLFRQGGNDSHVDILGLENIPSGYINPPTTATQRLYLKDLGQEILDAGGLGLIVWGGEWVGSEVRVYADKWGQGSSWENKAFWEFDHNLHDGVNWMQDVKVKQQ